MKISLLLKILGLAGLLAVSAALGIYTATKQARETMPQIPGLLWPNPKQIQPFTMLDHGGQEFTREKLLQRWSFMFFGYTNCPDICPMTMSVMSGVTEKLSAQNIQSQTLFVTVDPERDTQEKLQQYVHYFNPEFIGLGGSKEQIDAFTGQMGIPYYLNEADDTGFYLVDHTGSIFVSDPNGNLVAVLSGPHEEQNIVERFLRIRNFLDSQS